MLENKMTLVSDDNSVLLFSKKNSLDFLGNLSLLFHTNTLVTVDTNRGEHKKSLKAHLHLVKVNAEIRVMTYPIKCNCSLEEKHHTKMSKTY